MPRGSAKLRPGKRLWKRAASIFTPLAVPPTSDVRSWEARLQLPCPESSRLRICFLGHHARSQGSAPMPPAPREAGCCGQSAGAAPARLCSPGFALQRGANSMRCLPGKLAWPLPYQNPLTVLIGTKQQQGLPPPSRAEGSSWPLSGHGFFFCFTWVKHPQSRAGALHCRAAGKGRKNPK